MISKRFKRGLAIDVVGVPDHDRPAVQPIKRVTLYGADYRGLWANLLVEEGAQVFAGSALFSDRKRPEIKVTSPVCGSVAKILIGPRRQLSSITIDVREGEPIKFETGERNVKDLLCESGLWSRIVARPFGGVPDPDRKPEAIFVSTLDTAPGAPDPGQMIRDRLGTFSRGLGALADLTDGPVYVCADGVLPTVSDLARVRPVKITGRHPAGLFGTQIDLVHPLRNGAEIWQIHAQDVIATGDLLTAGTVFGNRVVAQTGPGLKRPRLVQVPMGAHLVDILSENVIEGRWRALSGPPIGGVDSAALRRDHFQVSVLPRVEPTRRRAHPWLPSWAEGPRPAAIVPTRAIDLSLGPDIPVVPLIRALSVGDVETADRLGARRLLEEDMALVTYAAGGKQDFGTLLRLVLDQIQEAA